MKPWASFIVLGALASALACTGEDPSLGPNVGPDGGPESAALALSIDGPVTLVQGTIAAAKVTITRSGDLTAPVSIVVSNLPADVSADGLVIAPDATTGQLQLRAGAEAPHGPSALKVIATAGTHDAIATVDVMVRGKPGTLDNSFSSNGSIALDVGTTESVTPVAMQIQGDKAVLLAQTGSDCAVARVGEDGTLDPTFGTAGIVEINGGGDDRCRALAVQGDGRIVVAGARSPQGLGLYGPFIMRFDANGTPDPSFGSGGVFAEPETNEGIDGLVAQPDARLVAVGMHMAEDGTESMLVLRVTAAGQLDPSFGAGGRTTIAPKDFSSSTVTSARAKGVGVLTDGNLVVAGVADPFLAFARVGAAGELVAGSAITFGAGASSAATHDLRAVVRAGADRLVLALEVTDTARSAALVALDGAKPDNGFGNVGRVRIDIGAGTSAFVGATILAGEKILAVGSTGTSATDWALARVTPAGERDLSFGNEGITTTSIGPHADVAHAAVPLPRERVLVVGTAAEASGKDRVVLARYWL